jgi:hypothetical protein
MEQENSNLERAMSDFRQSLPEAATCCNDIITEIIIVGSSRVELKANKVNAGSNYIWEIQSVNS